MVAAAVAVAVLIPQEATRGLATGATTSAEVERVQEGLEAAGNKQEAIYPAVLEGNQVKVPVKTVGPPTSSVCRAISQVGKDRISEDRITGRVEAATSSLSYLRQVAWRTVRSRGTSPRLR